ncbi:MAG: RNA 2',3'-cyclic phosphodiesterase [Candidatus Nitrosocaldus sp.]|nr:RNA 2',3'-cyclic phosphodiesterase [Candidatus Nitrosocaldus sp.]MDW8000928.1 RNA 2',3'-cyclic phosphodiesterase [Candidatus Nitrosocaldus sp.]
MGKSMSMRVFVAMDVRDEGSIGRMLEVQREFISLGLDAKPVSRGQLHFTLLFLGEIDPSMLEGIKDRLSSMAFEPVNVAYRGVGVFPNMKHPRVIWVGVDQDSASRLVEVARGVEDRLKPMGFRSDKQFTPHITLLRVRDGGMGGGGGRSRRSVLDALTATINRHSNSYFGSDVLDEIKVKRSELRSEGPVYTDIFSVKACHRSMEEGAGVG